MCGYGPTRLNFTPVIHGLQNGIRIIDDPGLGDKSTLPDPPSCVMRIRMSPGSVEVEKALMFPSAGDD